MTLVNLVLKTCSNSFRCDRLVGKNTVTFLRANIYRDRSAPIVLVTRHIYLQLLLDTVLNSVS